MLFTLLAQSTSIGTIQPATNAFSLNSQSNNLDVNGNIIAANNLEKFITNAIGALTVIGGLMFIFYFVMGGLTWISAGGDKGKIEKAREQMTQGVIGMVVIVIAYGLIGVISTFLGLKILNPADIIQNQLNPLNNHP